ncbi:phosphonate C-P lyase system protein PhnG [Actibacterium sp. 188UL27-1]|uniref:phosphonate C-P lyase system protein PhnG n=1 Tax=Actibacterium sp. 188UL27-1 TaxID=2786961 RepID=UPI0019586402|nr:phosphonate C-P lyase system protein PhnG [Actibacterium sp. 188UL27-1]MBM7067973.1 phosphonate C-P lyase system protein PhnG [Actibacterium sp. 188UL27-1]
MNTPNDRQSWMSLLAKAPSDLLATIWDRSGFAPQFNTLRAPEIGAVMVRGRMGGTGSAFNLGEMTITRCSVQLEGGAVGHAYVQGRDGDKARVAALVDALMQSAQADQVRAGILEPLQKAAEAARTQRAAKAAATKVDFFTMARGED